MSFWPIEYDPVFETEVPKAGLRTAKDLKDIPMGQWDSLEWLFYRLHQDVEELPEEEQKGLHHNVQTISTNLGAWLWEDEQILAQLKRGSCKGMEDIFESTTIHLQLCRKISKAKVRLREWRKTLTPRETPGRDEPFPEVFFMPGWINAAIQVWNCEEREVMRNVQAVDLQEGKVYHLKPPPFNGYEWVLGRGQAKKPKYPFEVFDYQPEESWRKPELRCRIVATSGDFRVVWATPHGEAPSEAMEAIAKMMNFNTDKGAFHDNILALEGWEREGAILRFLYERAPAITPR